MGNYDSLVIDGWQIEVDCNRIARHGVEQKLEPRSMELLLYLAHNPGQVVSRAEIEEQVWGGRVVGYEALSSSIAKIRKVFGDTCKPHRVIETIPKSGYRLIAPVCRSDRDLQGATATLESAPESALLVRLIPAVALLVALSIGIAWWQPWVQPGQAEPTVLMLPNKPSIAVLPFINMSADPGQEYFADGLTDDLITDLSKNPELFVISRNSTFVYKDKSVPIMQVARELGVGYVLEGSVQRHGNQVRINAQLIDAQTGGHAWSQRYDGYLDDLFTMRDRITLKIALELSVTLSGRKSDIEKPGVSHDPQAYDALLRGRDHYRMMTSGDLVKAIAQFEHAIEIDPDFSAAHAGLAASYWGICNNAWAEAAGMSYEECGSKTSQHLAEAMKNPSPLAHRIAARQHEYFKQWDEALVEAEKAIALNPNDPDGYVAMSALLVNQNRAAEGLESIRTAMRLDPRTDYLWRLGNAQFHLERYDQAAATMRRATRRNPDYDWNYILLAASYGHLGLETDARQAVIRFNELRVGKHPFTLGDLQYWSIKNETGLLRLREGLRKAGVPEHSPA